MKNPGQSHCVVVRAATAKDVEAIVGLWVELMDFHAALNPYCTRKPMAEKQATEFFRGRIE